MRALVTLLPLLVPVFLASLLLGALVARPLARRIGASAVVSFMLVASVGLIVAATLTPDIDASFAEPRAGGWCDLSRTGFPPLRTLVRLNDVSLNVILFVPLGLAVGLVPAGPAKSGLLIGALALPFVVELAQSLLTPLGRGCESADIIDNLTGLVIGLVVGLSAAWLGRRLDSRSRVDSP